jgi:hypothetical protein
MALLLEALVLLAAAGAAAAVLLLALLDFELDELEVELDEPLADLLIPLCPRQAPFVVDTVCDVPSLHWIVMLPLDAAACACTPGAAIITAAAITAINPNVFIEIPSSLNSPDAASARPQRTSFRRVACMRTTLPKRPVPTAPASTTMPEKVPADMSAGKFLRHYWV